VKNNYNNNLKKEKYINPNIPGRRKASKLPKIIYYKL
jgi:hypothetical protein